MNPKFYNRFKGFSVAEAMVTLLIVSIALSAIAPIFSKRNSATLNTQSKWEKTTNGHITRVSGNVGIGLANTVEPDSKLQVEEGVNKYRIGSAADYFSIKGASDTTIFEISKANGITFRLPQNHNEIMKFQNSSGDTVATINSDGSTSFISKAIQFLKSDSTADANAKVVIKDDGSAVFSAGNSTINADGSASFGVPGNAIMFFAECPNDGNWTDLGALGCTCSGVGCSGCNVNFGGMDASSYHACQRKPYGGGA